MDIQFKIARYEDVKDIITLTNECFDENTNVQQAKVAFKASEKDKNQIYLMGIMDGKVVAHTKITIVPTMFKGMDTYAILNHVCVKEEYRRHNLATKMLEEVERICKERHCIEIKLWSNNFRVPAHECYKHFGFNVVDAKFFSKEL